MQAASCRRGAVVGGVRLSDGRPSFHGRLRGANFCRRALANNGKLAYQCSPMSVARPLPERNLGFLLAEINRMARKEFDRRVRHLGLTRAQWLFLFFLGQQPGATQSDLAELLQMEKISVSRQARRLEQAGWIERRARRDDGRAYQLRLTPRAARIAAQLNGHAVDLRADFLRGLSQARRAELLDALLLIKGNLLRLGQSAQTRSFS